MKYVYELIIEYDLPKHKSYTLSYFSSFMKADRAIEKYVDINFNDILIKLNKKTINDHVIEYTGIEEINNQELEAFKAYILQHNVL